jgi:hypothetical protein
MNSKLYQRIQQILESTRVGMARTVNTTQVYANWLIGREIVEGPAGQTSRGVWPAVDRGTFSTDHPRVW